MTGSELAVREAKPLSVGPITAGEFDALFRTAKALAASRMFRDSVQAEQAFARILCGRDLGLSPTEAMTAIHIVEGKPELSADLQASMLRTYRGPDGERYDFRVTTPPDKRDSECHVEIRRREPGEAWEVIGTEVYTLDDARAAELVGKKNWKRFKRNMLFARAISNAIAFYAPETAHAPRMIVPAEGAAADIAPASVSPLSADADAAGPGDAAAAPSPPEPAADVEGTADEIDESDPAYPEPDPADRMCTQNSARLLAKIFREMSDEGREARFFEALDIVGAPDHEDVAQRVVGMTEAQVDEMVKQLGQYVAPKRSRTHA